MIDQSLCDSIAKHIDDFENDMNEDWDADEWYAQTSGLIEMIRYELKG